MIHKVEFRFDQSFSKWTLFVFYQIRVCKTFLIKIYSKPIERKCPTCKHDLVVRNSNKTGNKFFGCSQYPTCTHTEPINT